MTRADLVTVLAAALQAAVPLLPIVLAARPGAGPRRRLSPGRFLLPYALLFAAFLHVGRWFGPAGALVLLALLLGALGAGAGIAWLYGWLYGRSWLEANPGVVDRDVGRWHLPALVVSVVCMAVAVGLAYLPRLLGGTP